MTPSSLSVRHLSSATAERPFTRAGPMVRIRVPPAESRANLTKSPRQIQDAGPGHDTPDTRHQPATADRRTEAMPDWMARLLRLLPDPACAHQPGGVDPPEITLVSLAAVAERAQSLQ